MYQINGKNDMLSVEAVTYVYISRDRDLYLYVQDYSIT